MNVLVITGDVSFKPGHPRFDLQRSSVEHLVAVYWGRGSLWPRIPKEHFDIVTVQDPFWRGLFALQLARHLHCIYNVQVHTDLSHCSGFRRFMARFVLRRADSIRTVSVRIQEQIETMGVTTPVHVVPICVDPAPFRSLPRVPHEQKTILWIGRFEKEKDPLLAVQLLEDIRARGLDAKLVLLGTGTLEEELKRRARGLPVEFAGWQDPKVYLARADVVLSTSRHESWGASIVEALAAGVPVVAPDVGVAKAAGAEVVPRAELATTVLRVLKEGTRGELKLTLPSAEEWIRLWKASLV